MRIAVFVSLLGCLLLPVCGCDRKESVPKPLSASPFAERLKAAQAIADKSERDTALSQLAKDAADAGDSTIVRLSVRTIGDDGLRNQTTASAVLKLAKRGKGDDAATIARTIGDDSVRERVLDKLSKGDFSE